MKTYITFMMVVAFLVFVPSGAQATKLVKCGTEWINIHKGNPDLIGIHVQQLPDDIEDRKDYAGKHPAMVIYLFKGGRAHTVTYTPSGQVEDGVWHDVSEDSWIWKHLVDDMKEDVECAYWK